MLTFNPDSLNGDVGTEISGTLGFVPLHFLDVKIDYRTTWSILPTPILPTPVLPTPILPTTTPRKRPAR
jgi:hypothetical protein